MGLLDVFNSDEGLLGLSLLSAAGPSAAPASLGQRMAGAVQSYRQQKSAEEERRMLQAYRQAQMQAMQETAEDRQLARDDRQIAREQNQRKQQILGQLFPPVTGPQAVSMAGGPTNAAAELQGSLPKVDPDTIGRLVLGGIVSPEAAKAYTDMGGRPKLGNISPEKYTPESLARFSSTNNLSDLVPVERLDPNKPFMYQNGQIVPNPAYQDYELRKASAGSTRVNVPVSVQTGATFGKTLAEDIGKQVGASRDAAMGAVRSLDTIGRIESAINTGKISSGPFANQETVFRRVGEAIGVGGKNNQEVLANTQAAVKGLAQLGLDAASQIRGQGAVTENERLLLQRAASGDITLTLPELKVVTDVARRAANYNIGTHQRNVEALSKNPDVAPLMPFFQTPQPFSPVTRPTMRWNPQTGSFDEVK